MAASADPGHLEEVRGTIATYLRAVKANDIATLRGLFDAKANVAHYYVKKDTVVTNTLDEFMGVIQSLHAKFDNAEEIGKAMNVRLVKHLARASSTSALRWVRTGCAVPTCSTSPAKTGSG